MKQHHPIADDDAENPFWITYSDLLSSLLLVFLTLLFSFQIISMVQARMLKQRMAERDTKNAELSRIKSRLQADRKKFKDFLLDLEKLQKQHPKEISVNPKTGDVTIQTDNEWFGPNSEELKPGARAFLREVMPRYVHLVTDPSYKDTIKQVIVEGHADAQGDSNWESNYLQNLKLSQGRARSVNNFVLTILGAPYREKFRRLSSVAGRSNIEMITQLERAAHKERDYVPVAPTRAMLSTQGGKYRNVQLRLDWRNPLIEYDLILKLDEEQPSGETKKS